MKDQEVFSSWGRLLLKGLLGGKVDDVGDGIADVFCDGSDVVAKALESDLQTVSLSHFG